MWFVVGTNVTIRMSEEELRRLDELAQRMGKTRSDVVRDLINRFDEVLHQEVERERKKWLAIGFVSALESAIVDPEVVLRFVRRNVDALGYPDFIIGMIKVKNRVVVFSHHDKVGSQLLGLVRARVEEDVRREEAEIEREEDDEEDVSGDRPAPAYVPVHRAAPSRTPHAIPVATKYKLVITNRAAPPIAGPTTANTVGRSVINNGGGSAKSTVATPVPKDQKAGSTSIPTINNLATTQAKAPNPQASADGSGKGVSSPVGQGANHGLSGDFVLSLVTHSYHKYRNELLRAVESVMGD